jgi:arsenate reductase
MDERVVIWHYPRCSKSRQALDLLRERGIEPEIVKYRENPPDAETLDRVLKALGMEPRELMRRREKAYRALDLKDPSKTREELIEAMVQNPILIERAVVLIGDKAALGRPPEAVLSLFD